MTSLGETIIEADDEIKLDKHIKNVLAYKPVLARIFKETVVECRNMNYEEIEACIEGEISIDVVGLNPGTTNTAKIEGRTQEDSVNNEGKITFDIRTILRIPELQQELGVKILVDVEAQKNDTPGYDIIERAIFYCCRMISAQLSTEFTNETADKVKYGNLKKVYSIWICTETSQKKANTIERYNINRSVYPEKKEGSEPRYDLIEAIIVNISKDHNTDGSDSELINFLTDLFNEEMNSRKKIDLLKNRYKLLTTESFESEVELMTAYSAGLEKKGKIKGFEELSNLIQWLLKQNRIEDINAVTVQDSDKADTARQKLFEEYEKENGKHNS